MTPNEKERAWLLTDGGWLYVVENVDRAGNALVTLIVDDQDGNRIGLGEVSSED